MLSALVLPCLLAAVGDVPPRCEVLPLPHDQAGFQIEGQEAARWHWGEDSPRPFLHPLLGPDGGCLTRMGHPGAPNHDHHRGIWFAHHDVDGLSFWADKTGTRIRQRQWLAYEDGPEGIAAVLLDWIAPDGTSLIDQSLILAIIPAADGPMIEIQTELRPPAGRESTTLGKSNFGLLAVRVAKSVSTHFGGGSLSDSEGRTGEKEIFGQTARWIDFSGPVAVGPPGGRHWIDAGVTYFDHPTNERHPSSWHVRDDGWMGASFCMHQVRTLTSREPLRLRYLLATHRGSHDPDRASRIFTDFSRRPGFVIVEKPAPHRAATVERRKEPAKPPHQMEHNPGSTLR